MLTVSITCPLPVIVFGFTKQAASTIEFGSAQLKLMAPVKFAEPAMVIVDAPDWPACEIVVAAALRLKSSAVTASAPLIDSL